MSDTYSYGFVRKDLSRVQRIVQFGHACYELGKRLPQQDTEPCNLILFEVPNEHSLVAVARYLDICGINYYMFEEPDYNTGFTAIATPPVTAEQRAFFAEFDLFRDEDEDTETKRRRSLINV